MSRIVELLVGLNALGGIAAFLGIRWAGRKAHSQTFGRLRRDEEEDDTQDATPDEPGGAEPEATTEAKPDGS